MPRVLPVLRGGRQAVVPAVPAVGGHVPRSAVQYRVVRAADAHGGPADRPGSRRLRLDRWRLPHLRQPRRAGAHATGTGAVPVPDTAPAQGTIDVRVHVRGRRDRRLPAPPGHQGARRRLMTN